MPTTVTAHPPRASIALIIGTACAAALLSVAATSASGKSLSNQAIEPWLGKITPAVVPSTPASRSKEPAAARRPVPADIIERSQWWSVGGPAYRWNEIMLDEMQEAFVVLPMAARHLALLHAAIDDAVNTARQQRIALGRSSGGASAPQAGPGSEHAAAAEVAAAILTYLFPARAAHFAKLAEEAVALRTEAGSETAEAVLVGRDIGRKVAALAIARAKSDGSDAKWTGSVPTGPGLWNGTSPIAPLAGTWRPWVLTSASEFRPPAPPAFNSAETKAALAELKAVVRTPRLNHRAIFWEVHGGARAHTLWNEIARTKLLEYGIGVEDGVRVLSAVNVAMADAGTACWDAKFAYWYIRPPQLDAEVKSLFPPPNHPSFPAAHGCYSTAAATVLASIFARDRERLLALGKEAAEARVWAGIHYRFDIEAGEAIGRKVAEKVLARSFPAATK